MIMTPTQTKPASQDAPALIKCPICQFQMHHVFDSTILGKYSARYVKCPECELIKPENPHWLAESYSSAIAETDVGLVSRNLRNRDLLTAIFTRLVRANTKVLDVGGGYGLLCRLLRDKGWDCYTTDSYCQNLFAGSFEPSEAFKAPTLLAFEVFEHIENPLSFIREQISQYDAETFIFSTLTHHWDVPPSDWWYYAFETGQHVSIYKRATLQRIAKELGWHIFSISDEMHILTKSPVDSTSRILLNRSNRIISWAYRFYVTLTRRNKSLMMSDYESIKSNLKTRQTADPR